MNKRVMMSKSEREWVVAIGIIAIGLVLYHMVQSTGFIDTISPTSAEITFGVALLIGVVASLSSCMATIGGVVVAFAQRYVSTADQSLRVTIRPHLAFHIGRIGSFFVLGGVLGAIGGTIQVSGNVIAVITIVIAVIMAWLGLNILGIAPSIARVGIRMPERMRIYWNKVGKSEHKAAPFALGGLSFFLPCGFTQSMQLFALASGDIWIGGVSLALFAVGTMPALLTLGVASTWSSALNGPVFKKVAGLVVLLFAIATWSAGQALWTATPLTTELDIVQVATGEEQVVRTRIVATGFDTEVTELKKGVPVKWIIEAKNPSACTNRIIVPSLGISADIKVGENVVYFTPQEKGELPFSCWMGMVRGSFIVK